MMAHGEDKAVKQKMMTEIFKGGSSNEVDVRVAGWEGDEGGGREYGEIHSGVKNTQACGSGRGLNGRI
ncbi:MAG: hypothetical protein QME28_08105 [Candidatus Saccharicenans sp.]|nr:hypothetical protein [Candidatus Saccharicenans sp.]